MKKLFGSVLTLVMALALSTVPVLAQNADQEAFLEANTARAVALNNAHMSEPTIVSGDDGTFWVITEMPAVQLRNDAFQKQFEVTRNVAASSITFYVTHTVQWHNTDGWYFSGTGIHTYKIGNTNPGLVHYEYWKNTFNSRYQLVSGYRFRYLNDVLTGGIQCTLNRSTGVITREFI